MDAADEMALDSAGGIGFPVYCPQRRFRLAGAEVRVGRRSAHSGIDPEIDLTGPPADPGVSRDQIVPLRDGDRIHLGAWTELRIISDG